MSEEELQHRERVEQAVNALITEFGDRYCVIALVGLFVVLGIVAEMFMQ